MACIKNWLQVILHMANLFIILKTFGGRGERLLQEPSALGSVHVWTVRPLCVCCSLLICPQLDLEQPHLKPRPYLCQLHFFVTFTLVRVVSEKRKKIQTTLKFALWVSHLNEMKSSRLAKVITRRLSGFGTGKMCLRIVATFSTTGHSGKVYENIYPLSKTRVEVVEN